MSTLTHPLQHISGKDHVRRPRRSRRKCQHWGRTTTNPRFADNIDRLAGEEEKLTKLVERLDKASTAYVIEISAEKTNMMKVNGQKLDIVTSLKYLGSVKANEGSKPEIL